MIPAMVVVVLCAAGLCAPTSAAETERAAFAGGCFWSMQHVFDGVPGVVSATAGYAGGATKNPTYEQVEAGVTGHAESVEVIFNPAVISYDRLLDLYWHNIDPTDGAGQFCDYGSQYRPIIFYTSEAQRIAAERSKTAIADSNRFTRVLTRVEPLSVFWPAENYHQRFYKTHAAAYDAYARACGRAARLRELWSRP